MRAIPAGDKTDLVAMYVGEKCGCTFEPGMYTAMAILDDQSNFVAGVVISEYRGHDCQISCATETSAAWRPEVMRAVFDYVFNQLRCVRCTSIVLRRNHRCRTFLEGLGFVLEGRLRLGYDGVKDALLYGLLASECRYLEDIENGQIDPESPDAARPGGDGAGPRPDEQRDGDSEREPEQDRPVHAAGVFDF